MVLVCFDVRDDPIWRGGSLLNRLLSFLRWSSSLLFNPPLSPFLWIVVVARNKEVRPIPELVTDWRRIFCVLLGLRFSDREFMLVIFGFGFVLDFAVGWCGLIVCRCLHRRSVCFCFLPVFRIVLCTVLSVFYVFVFQIRDWVEADLTYFEEVQFRKPERVWFLNPKSVVLTCSTHPSI